MNARNLLPCLAVPILLQHIVIYAVLLCATYGQHTV